MISKLKYTALSLLIIFAYSAVFAAPALQPVTINANTVCNDTFTETRYTGRCPAGLIEGSLPPASTGLPHLLFSDLVNGPDTGLGDGNGSGAIVTVWGQKLGSSQGASTIEYCDSTDTCRSGYVYYWKDADGTLPSGPANLYESHQMQEIAFSIPDSATGAGLIKVTVGGDSSYLPFTVRSGDIYHVRSGGNDSNNGTYGSAWATVDHAATTISDAGAIVYVHDVDTGTANPAGGRQRALYVNNTTLRDTNPSTLINQGAFVSYPNTRPTFTGTNAIGTYNIPAYVFSKLDVYASSHSSVDANGQESGEIFTSTWGIQTTANGRVVGNAITDVAGMCASQLQGAIRGDSASADQVSNAKIYGNYIYDYGCEGSYRLHHTTYMSIRSGPDDEQIIPWEFGWNYLKDNWPKNGIHQFDQDADCGDFVSPLRIHNNVIVNQGGAGIAIGLSGCSANWPTEIYNNVLINVGLAAEWDGLDPETALAKATSGIHVRGNPGDVNVYNNTIVGWDAQDLSSSTKGCLGYEGGADGINMNFSDNVCYTTEDRFFVGDDSTAGALDDTTGDGNSLFSSFAGTKTRAIVPAHFTNSNEQDPLITVTGSQVSLGASSPIKTLSDTILPRDIYGNLRSSTSALGAVQ